MTGRGGERAERDAELLALARQLREAATKAGRVDVVAKVDEVVALLDVDAPPRGRGGDTVTRILDGLGF